MEPGATSASKLTLAFRFEDSIFQSSSSLPDYRKRLTKRLKKLQKSYKPPSADEPAGGRPTGANDILDAERSLRDKYGNELRFICLHAAEAVEAMREKHGSSRSEVLRQHTDNAEQWAAEIGLSGIETPSFRARRRRVPREAGYLDRLRTHLEQRVDNIRSHVVKLTRPDLFLEETLVRLEDDMNGRTADELAAVTERCLARSNLASPTAAGEGAATAVAEVRRLLERAAAPAPLARRGRKAGDVRDASLVHVNKIRAAAQALVGYMALGSAGKVAVRGALKRAHSAAVESVGLIVEAFREEDLEGRAEGEIRLEDAWNRILEYTNESTEEGGGAEPAAEGAEPERKRQKTGSSHRIVIRSKVLLAPGRKVPSNLLAALRRKKAELIRPPANVSDYASTHLRLVFGTAFDMTINFTPLLVTIRALPEQTGDGGSSGGKSGLDNAATKDKVSEFRRTFVDGGLPTWTPSSWALNRRRTTLSVLGVPGHPETIGPLVAKKLEFASCQATRVLRQCFAEIAGKAYANPNGSDFEVEISEATAMLKFLQITREAYCPGWQDVDS